MRKKRGRPENWFASSFIWRFIKSDESSFLTSQLATLPRQASTFSVSHPSVCVVPDSHVVRAQWLSVIGHIVFSLYRAICSLSPFFRRGRRATTCPFVWYRWTISHDIVPLTIEQILSLALCVTARNGLCCAKAYLCLLPSRMIISWLPCFHLVFVLSCPCCT